MLKLTLKERKLGSFIMYFKIFRKNNAIIKKANYYKNQKVLLMIKSKCYFL